MKLRRKVPAEMQAGRSGWVCKSVPPVGPKTGVACVVSTPTFASAAARAVSAAWARAVWVGGAMWAATRAVLKAEAEWARATAVAVEWLEAAGEVPMGSRVHCNSVRAVPMYPATFVRVAEAGGGCGGAGGP